MCTCIPLHFAFILILHNENERSIGNEYLVFLFFIIHQYQLQIDANNLFGFRTGVEQKNMEIMKLINYVINAAVYVPQRKTGSFRLE